MVRVSSDLTSTFYVLAIVIDAAIIRVLCILVLHYYSQAGRSAPVHIRQFGIKSPRVRRRAPLT